MNTLSWLILLADTLPKMAIVLSLLLGCALILGVILVIICVICIGEEQAKGLEPDGSSVAFIAIFKWSIVPVLVVWLAAMMVPPKATFYLIAGSEAGETVATSEDGKEILNDIKLIIKQQIKGLKSD